MVNIETAFLCSRSYSGCIRTGPDRIPKIVVAAVSIKLVRQQHEVVEG